MTKEEIIKELNVCDFQDQCVLAELSTMAQGALWMQEKMLDKICDWLTKHTFRNVKGEYIHGGFIAEELRKAMEYEKK